MDSRWEKKEQTSLRHHLAELSWIGCADHRLEKKLELSWIGCADHRLEKTAEQFYKHEGVLLCCERAKKVVTCIHTSSQVDMHCCRVCCAACVVDSIGKWKLRSLMCTVLCGRSCNADAKS